MKNSVSPGKDKLCVLLVADNPVFVFITTRVMQEYNELNVVGSVSREEAVQVGRSLRPEVILLDLDMPDQGSLETLSRLRAAMPRVGIVVLSMLDAASYRHAMLDAGAAAFVAKSAITTDLLPAILLAAQVARGEQGPSAESSQEKKP
jgi:DNA-binding NarL/FixJ family response regulator